MIALGHVQIGNGNGAHSSDLASFRIFRYPLMGKGKGKGKHKGQGQREERGNGAFTNERLHILHLSVVASFFKHLKSITMRSSSIRILSTPYLSRSCSGISLRGSLNQQARLGFRNLVEPGFAPLLRWLVGVVGSPVVFGARVEPGPGQPLSCHEGTDSSEYRGSAGPSPCAPNNRGG